MPLGFKVDTPIFPKTVISMNTRLKILFILSQTKGTSEYWAVPRPVRRAARRPHRTTRSWPIQPYYFWDVQAAPQRFFWGRCPKVPAGCARRSWHTFWWASRRWNSWRRWRSCEWLWRRWCPMPPPPTRRSAPGTRTLWRAIAGAGFRRFRWASSPRRSSSCPSR